jgi:hypothetical protein
MKDTDIIAQVLNDARDGIGMGVLHLAAMNGNCRFLASAHSSLLRDPRRDTGFAT